jgi:hypothetical protein
MRRGILFRRTTAVAMLAAITLTASTLIAAPAATAGTGDSTVLYLRAQIRHSRASAVIRARWLGILLHTGNAEQHTTGIRYLIWMRDSWRARSAAYGRALHARAGVYRALLCIHRYEGSWTAYSPAGPYYGGLQMDATFMAHWGPTYLALFGDARHWPHGLQVAAAYRAVKSLGYTPWPVSSRACGL